MIAGRELDALIAEKVMGGLIVRDRFTGVEGKITSSVALTALNLWHGVPHYSTNIADAWLVVEKMQSKGWAVILDNMQDYLGNWQVHFEFDREHIETAESESAPHAICLAALRAVNV